MIDDVPMPSGSGLPKRLQRLVLLPLLLVLGCTTAIAPDENGWRTSDSAPPATRPGQGPDEERALLLLIEDRRLFEPATVDRAMLSGPESKARLALVLGRVAHIEGLHLLEEFLLDPDEKVRRNAAFSLLVAARRGDLPESFVRPERGLAGAVSDPDPDVARWAIQAMAASGAGLERCLAAVERRLGGRNLEVELWRTLAGALFFLPGDEARSSALLGLERLAQLTPETALEESETAAVRRELFAVWSLGDPPRVEGNARSLLMARAGLGDVDPLVRAMAAEVLAVVGQSQDLQPLLQQAVPLLSSPEAVGQNELEIAHLRATALRASGRLLARAVSVAPRTFTPTLIALFDDPVPGVRQSAYEVAEYWLLDEALSEALISVATDEGGTLARVHTGVGALVALASAEHPRAAELVERTSQQAASEWRVGAATAAGLLGLAEPLVRLSKDEDPRVRASVLRARLNGLVLSQLERIGYLETALEDRSGQVRVAAYQQLSKEPELGVQGLLVGLDNLPKSSIELRLAAVDAIFRYAQTTASERGGSIALLEKLAEDPAWTVRRLAAKRLGDLGRPRPEVKKPRSVRGPDYYRGITQGSSGLRQAVMETTAGTLTLTFECQDAPQTCVSVLQLAEQGFYDGLPFFSGGRCILATGDPDGSGHGGPGYRLHDEPVALRADRPGVVFLRRTAPDSGASQLAISMCPAHELDGDWPAIGRVVEGLSILTNLAPGETVVRFRVKGE